MSSSLAARVAWYRFRCTWGERWGGYLALALLIGLVGGLAMGSVAAARRTQAAFPAYLASTNPSDLTVLTGLYGVSGSQGYDPAVVARIAALPHVRHVSSYLGLNVAVRQPGAPDTAGPQGLSGSLDGEFFTTDRLTVVQGRIPDPGRLDEAVIDARGTPAQIHVGTAAPLGFFTNAQVSSPASGSRPVKPYLTIRIRIVGKAVYSSEETQDDIDTERDGGALFTTRTGAWRSTGPSSALASPCSSVRRRGGDGPSAGAARSRRPRATVAVGRVGRVGRRPRRLGGRPAGGCR